MIPYYGDYPEDHTEIRIPFNTFDSNDPSASVTITNLADADIKVHADGSLTQIATDGASVVIDFDSITGNHMVLIDSSVHADYTTGTEYAVRLEGTTVDGATINAWIGTFSIERAGGALALIKLITAAGPTNTQMEARTLVATDYFDPAADAVANVTLVATTTTNTDMRGTDGVDTATMRGTDNAALASVLGALNDAAAVGDVTTADTLMQYAKQLLNELSGSTGIGTMPSGVNPANAVNLFEMVRAGLGATFDTAIDSNEQLQIDTAAVKADTAAVKVQTDKLVFTVANQVDANMVAISDDATAAAVMEALMDGAVVVQVNVTSSTTTAVIDGFTSTRDDQFKGRLITILNGVFEQTDITAYVHATQTLTFTATTGAPADNVFMVIH